MFYIIETNQQLEKLREREYSKIFLEVIPSSNKHHSSFTSLCCIYIRIIGSKEGFIIPIDHNEGSPEFGIEGVINILKNLEAVYTVDKKKTLYYLQINNLVDLQILYQSIKNDRLELPKSNPSIEALYRRFETYYRANSVMPLSKLFEACESLYDSLKHTLNQNTPEELSFYNNKAVKVFFALEQSPIRVNRQKLLETFNIENPDYSISDSLLYSQYSLNNITGRPTNSFNGLNMLSIPKDLEHRSIFMPTLDKFVELDYDGYHIRLICNLIDYKLSEESIHNQLGKLYFKKNSLTDKEYEDSKKVTFHAIYGNIPEEYRHIPLLRRIEEYSSELWAEFHKKGFIKDPISGKRFIRENLKNMNKTKLFSYFIQSLETSRNILILYEMIKYLMPYKSFISLYTYDSILIDKRDGEDVIGSLKDIMQQGGFPAKTREGNNMFF